ncbi:hypothetical protein BCR34DRAFT_492575 [Clohesyomyces aquaticus]|uniref:Uncharacterized protein n=1 Tax=Clohesyomyces aquaticus TaxID=1231657 RepID=A0A1Y1Z081_9PLEO|nr:hypothetical protein BCR34DRAFT_492575 [Clohesyomyces aquaticus]
MAPGPDLSFLAQEVDSTTSTNVVKTSTTTPLPAKVFSTGSVVLDPSQITTDFDELRFEAAAFGQLQVPGKDRVHPGSTNEETATETAPLLSADLVSSPYNIPGHYLTLTSLNTHNLIFAKALTGLKPVRSNYATAPYTQALNFTTVLELVRGFVKDEGIEWKEQSFYVVIFRSKLRTGVDSDLLYQLDCESHREACECGGLLKYWFGRVDEERRNLATCFWRSREDARLGGLGPWHAKARAAGRQLYESIIFSTHRFTVLDGAEDFRFEDWE